MVVTVDVIYALHRTRYDSVVAVPPAGEGSLRLEFLAHNSLACVVRIKPVSSSSNANHTQQRWHEVLKGKGWHAVFLIGKKLISLCTRWRLEVHRNHG